MVPASALCACTGRWIEKQTMGRQNQSAFLQSSPNTDVDTPLRNQVTLFDQRPILGHCLLDPIHGRSTELPEVAILVELFPRNPFVVALTVHARLNRVFDDLRDAGFFVPAPP